MVGIIRLLCEFDAMGLISPACKFRANFFRTTCTPFQPVSLRAVRTRNPAHLKVTQKRSRPLIHTSPEAHTRTGWRAAEGMASDASVSSPDSSPSARRRAQPLLLGSGASTPSRLSAEAAAQLQVEHAGLNKRLERVDVERKGAEQRAHEKEEENHALRREKDELEHQLRRKQLEVETLSTLNREQAAEHRGRYTALQVQASDLECQLSAQRSRISELEEELRREKSAAAREQELVAQLQRQEEEASLAREASEREREKRKQREKEMLQGHRERLKKQSDASLREQEKLRRSHSQAVEVLNLKVRGIRVS